MSLYSDTLRKRYQRDAAIELEASEKLLNPNGTGSQEILFERLEQVEHILLNLLHSYGREGTGVSNCETVEEVLEAMLDPEGIMYEKIDLVRDKWRSQTNLILAFQQNGSAVILSQSLFGFCYSDGTPGKKRRYRAGDLQPKAFIIYRPLNKDSFSVWHFLRLMASHLSPKDIPCIIAATAAVSLLGLAAPAITLYILNDYQKLAPGSEALQIFWIMLVLFLVSGLLKGVFSIIKTLLLGKIRLRISSQMQTAVMAKVLLMPYSYFQEELVGKQSARIRGTKELTDMLVNFIINNLLGCVFALVSIPQMTVIASGLVIPALAVFFAQIVVSILFNIAQAKHTRELLESRQESDAVFFDLIRGIYKVIGTGAQRRAFAMTVSKYSKVLDLSYHPALWIRLNSVILTAISSFSTVLVLIIAAKSGIPNSEYIAFTASFGVLSSTVDSLVGMARTIISIRPNLEEMHQLFSYTAPHAEGNRYVRALRGNIDIENLSFSYKKDAPLCLNHINLHIRAGEKVAIVGESGCGKSTLLKLLIGLIQPTSGSILYDGLPLSSFNLRSFRKRVGSVFQFSRVFPGTILENISFCAPETTEEEAWEAAEKACIDEEIRALPLGMDTEINEDANGGFSGGQRQRLILARVFAQKPGLILLDEATSALDNRSQHHVLTSVYALKSTVIMVAHRLSTVKNCDRIIVIRSGRIAEVGDYETLMNQKGVFYELVKKQQ